MTGYMKITQFRQMRAARPCPVVAKRLPHRIGSDGTITLFTDTLEILVRRKQ